MTVRLPLLRPGLLVLVAGLTLACSGMPSIATEATASAPPAASSSGTAGSSPTVDVDRVTAHVRALAIDVGPRPAGSEPERRAARYIADVLAAEGYLTAIETFSFPERYDESTVTYEGAAASDPPIGARLLDGSALGTAEGPLVDAGTGLPEEVAAADAAGSVVLMRRGAIPFSEKVANALQAGAVAVLVMNNEPGPLRGTLGGQTTIPALALDGDQSDVMQRLLGRTVQVTAAGGTRTRTSQNVVGRRGTCRAYLGAHYDSVAQGPGANDNATGTASMLEIARVRSSDGLCVVAFGSEENGLYGSQAFVQAHRMDETVFMVNFDMMGRIDDPLVIGDDALTEDILEILDEQAGHPLRAGAFPPYASSDHVSFSAVGVPAVTITSGNDPNIHTAGDDYEAVRPADLDTMLDLGDAAVAGLVRTLSQR